MAEFVRKVYALSALASPPFDRLLYDGDRLTLAEETIEVWAMPGHFISSCIPTAISRQTSQVPFGLVR